jgi:hypothetical protein
MLQVFYLNVAYVLVATHMLQAYILNVSFVLDICCCKSSMLWVFHEAGGRAREGGDAGVQHGTSEQQGADEHQ